MNYTNKTTIVATPLAESTPLQTTKKLKVKVKESQDWNQMLILLLSSTLFRLLSGPGAVEPGGCALKPRDGNGKDLVYSLFRLSA